VLAVNEEFLPHSTKKVNDHFFQHIPTTFFYRMYDPAMDRVFPIVPRRRFGYTAISYMISSEATRVLVDLVDRNGLNSTPDPIIVKLLDLIPGCYVVLPLLVHLPKTTKKELLHADDSDLWYSHDTIPGAPFIAHPTSWIPGVYNYDFRFFFHHYYHEYHYNF
jgi:hypothetical protein